VAGRIKSIKKNLYEPTDNRTRELPACSTLLKTPAPPRTPRHTKTQHFIYAVLAAQEVLGLLDAEIEVTTTFRNVSDF